MIKGAKNITQYKILEWVQQNFYDGSVEVEFTHDDKAIIKDKAGETLNVSYTSSKGVIID